MTHAALQAAHLMDRVSRLARFEEQVDDLYPAQWGILRYLAKANRFSRTPMAMTKYFGATRGTISQSINALEKKGFVERVPSLKDKRSVNVQMTELGHQKLTDDPLATLADDLHQALGESGGAFTAALEAILRQMINRNGGVPFGQCKTCQHFQTDPKGSTDLPFRCALLGVGLSKIDSELVCVEQTP